MELPWMGFHRPRSPYYRGCCFCPWNGPGHRPPRRCRAASTYVRLWRYCVKRLKVCVGCLLQTDPQERAKTTTASSGCKPRPTAPDPVVCHLGLRSGFDPPDLDRPGRLPHQQGLCEARLGYQDESPQGAPLAFGGCAFPPVSLGPAGDCPCRD